MGILDGIVEWIAEQVMHGLDLINTSVLGALGCDMSVFLRYFPAVKTMYDIFVALDIGGTPYSWILTSALPNLSFADFNSVLLTIIGVCANGAVTLIVPILLLILAALALSTLCVPALALTESEVKAQVAASGKEAVTGNMLIWFLCAVAFLKVLQKIDSFMATLGVNVGRTGGSLLAEAMIAMQTVTMVMGGGHGGRRRRQGGGKTRLLRDGRIFQGRISRHGRAAHHQQRGQDGHLPDLRCPYRSKPRCASRRCQQRRSADSGQHPNQQ